MKTYTLFFYLLLPFVFVSCNGQEAPTITNDEKNELQEFFGIKGNVKEINTESEVLTTMGKEKYTTITSFYKNGVPKETKSFKNGKLQSKEPWRVRDKKEEKGWELVENFDSEKRLLKATKYNYGKIVSETEYKYDASGKRIAEFEKINNTKKNFEYNKSGKISEEVEYQANDNYWCSKKKYSYNDKMNLIETLVYYYPDDKKYSGKIICEYDTKGSLTKSITYNKDNIIIENKNRKITYY